MNITTAFTVFSGAALRALNADRVPSPFGPNIIANASQRIGDIINTVINMLNRSLIVTITASNATGGDTDSALTASATDLNGNAIRAAVQVLIVAQADQYDPLFSPSATVTFSSATRGSIVDQGAGWVLATTDAQGQFACTMANSADGTLYVHALTPVGGASDTSAAALLVTSNSATVAWAA